MINVADLRHSVKLSEGSSYENLRDTVVSLWETATGRLWSRRVGHVEYRSGAMNPKLILLGLWPIEVITSVEYRPDGSSSWTAYDASAYVFESPRTLEKLSGQWESRVRITYTGGYTDSPDAGQAKTPEDVKRALLTQAQFMTLRLAGSNVHLRSIGAAGGSSSFLEEATLHPLVEELAMRYARKTS